MEKNIRPTCFEDKIPLKQLHLWPDNPRFLEKSDDVSEELLIKYFCEDRDKKVLALTKEIVANFNNPILERLVVPEDKGNHVVLEGNRRLVVYKLLANPYLAPDDNCKKEFIALKKDIDIDNNFLLP